jgi:hypothetical protein
VLQQMDEDEFRTYFGKAHKALRADPAMRAVARHHYSAHTSGWGPSVVQ